MNLIGTFESLGRDLRFALRSQVSWRKGKKSRFISLTERFVSSNPDSIKEIPGARALVGYLLTRIDIQVAIAIGGVDGKRRRS